MAALARGLEEELSRLVELGLRDVPPIRQKLIVKRLASLAGLDEATIMRSIPAGRRPPTTPTTRPEAEGPAGAPDNSSGEPPMPPIHAASLTAADHMLGCILCDGDLLAGLSEHERDFIGPEAYRWPLLRRVAQIVHDLGEEGAAPDLSGVLRQAEEVGVKDAAVSLATRIDTITDRDRNRLHAHWRECLVRARQDHESRRHQGGADVNALLAQIKLKRSSHAALGADRRVLPKPS